MKKLLKINIEKFYIIMTLSIISIIFITYSSFAVFTLKKEKQIINIVTGSLNYNLNINQITIEAGKTKLVKIEIQSQNTIDSYYQLIYDKENIIVEYIKEKDPPYGQIKSNETKQIHLVITNSQSIEEQINFDIIGGFIGKKLEIPQEKLAIEKEYLQRDIIIQEYNYKEEVQTLTIPYTGVYKIELWGAGANNHENTALGSYTAGNIELRMDERLYFYLGQKGTKNFNFDHLYQFNGGGYGNYVCLEPYPQHAKNTPGAGATDVRLVNGKWDDFNSLKSRIMVAAGAGGDARDDIKGSAGGGLYSDSANSVVINGVATNYQGNGAGQTYGGTINGGFGKGGYAIYGGGECYGNDGGGGGSGYYGGGGSTGGSIKNTAAGGAGGSSYISGHNGCDAISADSTEENIMHTGQSIHYSNYQFTDTIMIDGNGYQWTSKKEGFTGIPSYDHSTTLTTSSNGYAKITLLKTT